jgi:Spy/CpxP family protein refolding chaperone
MKSLRPVLVAVALTGAASLGQAVAHPVPPLPTTKPGSEAVLLGTDTVRKDLNLTTLQRTVLNDIRTEYREDARAIVAKVNTGKLSKKEAQAQLESLTASSNRRALHTLSADQRARLTQIEHQILGAFMLLSGDVQKELALTPKQKEKLAYVWWRTQKTASAINKKFEDGKISYYERIIELRDNRIDRSDDMLERLTKEQRAKLDQLAGVKMAS